ncbi:hypothetical protein GJ633_02915, partial [Halorubrum sp. CBA1125]|nr:hypothetical protein [Halorubrum sp. CBA1125]
MSDDIPASEADETRSSESGAGSENADADGADPFAAEIDKARDLLDGDGIEAVHVGVVRDGEV